MALTALAVAKPFAQELQKTVETVGSLAVVVLPVLVEVLVLAH